MLTRRLVLALSLGFTSLSCSDSTSTSNQDAAPGGIGTEGSGTDGGGASGLDASTKSDTATSTPDMANAIGDVAPDRAATTTDMASPTSDTATPDAARDASPTDSFQALLPLKSTWKYLDDGSEQGVAWRAPAFNDATWKSGPAELGYGDTDEATVVNFGPDSNDKFITTYFRTTFEAKNVAGIKAMVLQMVVDDGAIVYLNGEEVWRYNMPAGDVSAKIVANMAIGGADESAVNENALVSPSKLVEGRNTVAVEIHQSEPTSSDISFDFAVKVDRGGPDGGAADAGTADGGVGADAPTVDATGG